MHSRQCGMLTRQTSLLLGLRLGLSQISWTHQWKILLVAPALENERNEEVKENQETSKVHKKEEEISVRSALKAAFAKYSSTSGSKRKAVVQAEREEDDA
ncbi:Excision repair cross-complementation group 1, variant 2 [Salvia divinorum]|uniref:Excision repair cross-complementation group 1, variant 2 n=1 Tax=Salvia divinorum TaxID=28513 RepID=A0ABD1GDM8_SALDI